MDQNNLTLCKFNHIPGKYFTLDNEKLSILKKRTKNEIIDLNKQETKTILKSKFTRYGKNKPSVTQIISLLPVTDGDMWLINWMDRITGEEYQEQQVKNRSIMERGTELHKCFEILLSQNGNGNRKIEDLTEDEQIRDLVTRFMENDAKTLKVIETERFVDGDKTCGTVDLIAEKEGKTVLIDFKTTSKEFYNKNSKNMDKYFMQLSVYNRLSGSISDDCIIYQFSFKEMDYKTFSTDKRTLIKNEIEFRKVLNWYWGFF